MALINTTTTGVLGSTFYGDGSGDLTVQQNGVTVNKITSAPAFSAYGTAVQNISTGTFTKVTFGAEDYDTNNNFASSRFTPTVAGYYQLNLKLQVAATSLTRVIADFRKNGDAGINGRCLDFIATLGSFGIYNGTSIVYFNGSTDYVEIFVYADGTGQMSVSSTDKNTTFFQAALIRSA